MSAKKFLFVLLFSSSLFPQKSYGQIQVDPRLKAVGTMALYGTAGGFLLGIASLAFDTRGRNVAQGTSLGLYAGLIFGGYVVSAHYMKRYRELNPEPEDQYYPDAESFYETEQRWDSKKDRPLFYLDLLRLHF